MVSRVIPIGLVAAAVATGCGATLTTKRMALPAEAKRLSGIAVNQNVPHTVIAVFPKGAEPDDTASLETVQMLPSQKEIYVIGYRGQLFTTRELQVDLHPDSSVKRVKVGSEAQTEKMFQDLTAAAAQATAIREANKNPEDPSENDERAEQLCTDMLTVNAANAAAGLPLTYPTVTSCP